MVPDASQITDQGLLQQLWKFQACALGSQLEVGPPGLCETVVEGWQDVLAEVIEIQQEKFSVKIWIPHPVQETMSSVVRGGIPQQRAGAEGLVD